MHFDLGECPRWTLLDVLVMCARSPVCDITDIPSWSEFLKNSGERHSRNWEKTDFKKLIERNWG